MKTKTLLIVCAVLALAGCSGQGQHVRSVADFVHDIDAARAVLQDVKAHPERSSDPEVINASQAVAASMSPSLEQCWHGGVSTATTDNACLDQHGFKR